MKRIIVGLVTMCALNATAAFASGIDESWCNDKLRELRYAKDQASIAINYGDYYSAANKLVDGLRNTTCANCSTNNSLTLLTAKRGIQLTQAIQTATGSSVLGTRTLVYFLFGYYDFIENVAMRLDSPYYIPYFRQYGGHCQRGCGDGFDMFEFERRYLEFISNSIEVVLNNLAQDSGQQVYPVGQASAFFSALRVTALNAASDLSSSLWATRYACEIEDLELLAARLSGMNGGYRYGGEPVAMNEFYRFASHIANSIGANADYCRGRRHY
jgi:hypothetical protein